MPIKIAVVGSRQFPRQDLISAYVAALPMGTVVVSGGAAGVDTFAAQAAKANGFKVLIFYANWDGLGRRAGPIRNAQIVEASDQVVAFWDGYSRGTLNTVATALCQGKPVQVFDVEGREMDVRDISGLTKAVEAADV